MKEIHLGLFALAAMAPQFAGAALLFGDAEKGAELEAAKCQACHAERFGGDATRIYLREDRRLQSLPGLMKQVSMCNTQIGLDLSESDEEDLVIYLNEQFYKFE